MKFIEFITKNWQLISIILVILLEVISILVKKGKTITLPEGFLSVVLGLVIDAEAKYGAGNGKEKLLYVIEKIKEQFPNANEKAIKLCVEEILSSPTKKGVYR